MYSKKNAKLAVTMRADYIFIPLKVSPCSVSVERFCLDVGGDNIRFMALAKYSKRSETVEQTCNVEFDESH